MKLLRTYIALLFCILYTNGANAVNITWTNGSGDANWSNGLNWDTGSVPGAADLALFNATSITNCNINTSINIGGIDIQIGYTGTITTLAGHTLTIGVSDFSQANGVFIGGDSPFNNNGNFTISGGDFTAPSGVLSIRKNFTFSGGTYDPNSAEILFNGGTQSVNGIVEFHDVTLNKSGNWEINNEVTIDNTFLITGTAGVNINGPAELVCLGDIQLDNTSPYYTGTGTVRISGNVDQMITSTVSIRKCALPNVIIDKSAGTATFNGIVSINRDWTYVAGAIDYTTFSATIGFVGSHQSVNGAQDFYNVTLSKANDWDINDDININNDFFIIGGSGVDIDGPGIVNCKGDINLQNPSPYFNGNGTIKITGTADQAITSTVGIRRGALPNVIIDKSAGTATFNGIVSINRDWTYTAGIVDYTTFSATIGFSGSNQSVNGVQDFYNVTLSKSNNWDINDDININNDFLIIGGSGIRINSPGIVSCKGNIDLQNPSTYFTGTGTIKITGTADQTITSTVGIRRCALPNVIIDKSAGTASFSGLVSINRDWTYLAGTVDHSTASGTIGFTGSHQSVNGIQDFYNVTLSKSNDWDINDDININNDFLIIGGSGVDIDGPGIVSCKGDIDLQNSSTYFGGNGTVKITGTANQSITSTVGIRRCALPNVIIDKSAGTASFSGEVSVKRDWTYLAGTVDHSTASGTICFTGSHQSVNGVQDFYNVTLSKSNDWDINDDININNDFSIIGGSGVDIDGPGIVSCKGDVDLNNGSFYFNGNGTIKITGTADQAITSTVGINKTKLPHLIIDKTGGTATLDGIISFGLNFTYVQGNVDATTNLSTVASLGSGTTIDGESIAGIELVFYNLSLSSGTRNQTLTGNVEVDNFMQLKNTRLNMNTNEITLNNEDSLALSTSIYGIVKSEATDNSAKVNWNIGTNTIEHIILFGNSSNTRIPFNFQNTDGSDLGVISVSTYPTPADNTPFPTSPVLVTNMAGESVVDNTPFTIDRFWQIDRTSGTGRVDMTFTYAQIDVTSSVSGNEGILEAQRYEAGTNSWQEALPGQVQNAATNKVTVTNVTTFSPWTLAINTSPLPIELISFTAKNNGDFVDLNWVTASETNNDRFTVERSKDGKNFEYVTSQKGAGNSSVKLYYSDVDRTPLSGTSYYRLKQTDFDGQITYSKAIRIERDVNDLEVVVYPNPSNGTFTIINAQGALTIFDMSGKVVFAEDIMSETTEITLTGVASGVYMVNIATDNGIKISRVIIK